MIYNIIYENEMKLEFLSKSCNEAFARIAVAAFASQLDPTIEEIADIKTAVQGYEDLLSMMRIIMPGAFLISAPVLAFINYWAAKKILAKLGETFEPFPPFANLQVPGWILIPYTASLFAVTYFYMNAKDSWMYDLSVNVQTVTSFLLVLQGICIIYWFVENKKKPSWWAHMATTLMFFIPLFSQMIVYVGAFDIIFDYRKIRSKRLR